MRFAEIFEICPECGVRHERLEGSWLAAVGLTALLGLSVGVWATLGMSMSGRRVSLPLVLVVAGVVMVGSYRPIKGLVFAVLHALLHVDPVREGNVVFMDRFKKRRGARKAG